MDLAKWLYFRETFRGDNTFLIKGDFILQQNVIECILRFSYLPGSLAVSDLYCDEQELGTANVTAAHYASTSSSISQAPSNNIKVSRLQCSSIPRDFFCPIYLITAVETPTTINIIQPKIYYILRRTIQSNKRNLKLRNLPNLVLLP